MLKFLSRLVLLLLFATFIIIFSTSGKAPLWQWQDKHARLQIGGSFSLINQDGNQVSSADFHGRPMLVFFGFTRCPDICPVTSGIIARTLGLLGQKADMVSAVFITIDPEHDTPEVLKSYLVNFDARITGLTGSKEQVEKAAAAYKAYFKAPDDEPAQEEGHSQQMHDHHGDKAQIDHSGFIYLMDKEGGYYKHFSYNASAEQLAAELSLLLEK